MYSFAENMRNHYERKRVDMQCKISKLGIYNGKLYGITGFCMSKLTLPEGHLVRWDEKAKDWVEVAHD